MGTLADLQASGLDVKFDAYMDEYFLDDGKKAQLREMVDQHGLDDVVVMKTIGQMQREEKLKAGIYMHFKALKLELEGSTPQEPTSEPQEPTSEPEALSGGNGQSGAPVSTQGSEESEEESEEQIQARIEAYAFSEAQEAMIKRRLEAEEEKIRKRLLAQERKIREQIVTGKVRKQTRLGLKPEQAKAYREAKQALDCNRDKIKQLREENKQYKAVIDSLRPKRNVRQKSHAEKQVLVAKRKLTMALKTSDDALIEAAKLNLQNAENVHEAEIAAQVQ